MTETSTKKPLPKVFSDEAIIPADYIILRGMVSKRAYRTQTHAPNQFVSFKIVKDEELGYQFMIHVRFEGEDRWFGDHETIDLDAYLPIPDLSEELLLVLKDLQKINLVARNIKDFCQLIREIAEVVTDDE